jgi:hypothetical protein
VSIQQQSHHSKRTLVTGANAVLALVLSVVLVASRVLMESAWTVVAAVAMVKVVASAMMEEAGVGAVVNPVEKVVVTANSNIAVFPFLFCCSALHALSKPS